MGTMKSLFWGKVNKCTVAEGSGVVISLSGLLALLAFNLSTFAYAWLYLHTYNLVAGVLYLALWFACCVGASFLLGRLKKTPPDPLFGCLAVAGILPGIFLGIFLVVPYLQLTLSKPLLGVSVAQASQAAENAEFYSFHQVVSEGPGSTWHKEKKSRRSGDSTTRWTAHFQVAPLTDPDWDGQTPPRFWLTSEREDAPAFSAQPRSSEELHALRLAKPDPGFERAVGKACETLGISPPEQPVLLEVTPAYDRLLSLRQDKLVKGLGGANLILLLGMLGLSFWSSRRGNDG